MCSLYTNIAEGAGRSFEKDFKRFLEIAIGSSFELKTQIMISQNLGYLEIEKANSLNLTLDSILKQLNGFIKKLKSNI